MWFFKTCLELTIKSVFRIAYPLQSSDSDDLWKRDNLLETSSLESWIVVISSKLARSHSISSSIRDLHVIITPHHHQELCISVVCWISQRVLKLRNSFAQSHCLLTPHTHRSAHTVRGTFRCMNEWDVRVTDEASRQIVGCKPNQLDCCGRCRCI